MRSTLLPLVAALCALTVASARGAESDVHVPACAESAPAPADYVEAYPNEAMRAGIEQGSVNLICTIRTDRTLACSVQRETPQGVGFGEAALRVVEKFVVRPVEEDARLVVGSRVVVPIQFYLQ